MTTLEIVFFILLIIVNILVIIIKIFSLKSKNQNDNLSYENFYNIETMATIYSNCSTLNVGCKLYTTSNLSVFAQDGKYSNGTWCYTVGGGAGLIVSSESCNLASPIVLRVGLTVPAACSAQDNTYWLQPGQTFADGTVIYINQSLTTPLTGYNVAFDVYGTGQSRDILFGTGEIHQLSDTQC